MKKILALVILIILLSFSGCTTKEYVYIESPKYPFSTIQAPDDIKFPVRNDYVDAYLKWKKEMYLTIDTLNAQIVMYTGTDTNKLEK